MEKCEKLSSQPVSKGPDASVRRSQPLRVLFRVYNRRGLGHWMRGMNITHALWKLEPDTCVRFFTNAPPFQIYDPRILHTVAEAPDAMDVLPSELYDFAPDIIVDDTIPPATLSEGQKKHVFIMRRCAAEKQAWVVRHPSLARMDAIIVPHTEEEFSFPLPTEIATRTAFVGAIVRKATPDAVTAQRERMGLARDGFCLVSTPGGGGFQEDSGRLIEIARLVHVRLASRLAGFRQILVLGPNGDVSIAPTDAGMTVLASEPDMASLIACADAVLSAGGYNTVSEIRLARRPAFFLPGSRGYDDQRQRVEEVAARGLAMVVGADDPAVAADAIASTCLAPDALAAMRAAYERDPFRPGNLEAARVILACARGSSD